MKRCRKLSAIVRLKPHTMCGIIVTIDKTFLFVRVVVVCDLKLPLKTRHGHFVDDVLFVVIWMNPGVRYIGIQLSFG